MVEKIGIPAMLEQTAEECSELSMAAIKLLRILYGENPTPVTEEEAQKALKEEFSDVMFCASDLGLTYKPVYKAGDIPADRKLTLELLAKSAADMASDALCWSFLARSSGEDHSTMLGLGQDFSAIEELAGGLGISYDVQMEEEKQKRFRDRWNTAHKENEQERI